MTELGVPCVALHSMMSQVTDTKVSVKSWVSHCGCFPQNRRIAALSKFKSSVAQVLICTDVAGRGLDIPSVELVRWLVSQVLNNA
jgi:ERCC4-related helicase